MERAEETETFNPAVADTEVGPEHATIIMASGGTVMAMKKAGGIIFIFSFLVLFACASGPRELRDSSPPPPPPPPVEEKKDYPENYETLLLQKIESEQPGITPLRINVTEPQKTVDHPGFAYKGSLVLEFVKSKVVIHESYSYLLSETGEVELTFMSRQYSPYTEQ